MAKGNNITPNKASRNQNKLENMGFSNKNTGENYEIPVEGSLGLLALGYVGIMKWRAVKRDAMIAEQLKNNLNK